MKKISLPFSKRKIHRPLIYNLVVWLLGYIILVFAFSKGSAPVKIDYVYTFGFLTSIIIPVIVSAYILIPKLLKRESYALYVVLLVVNIFVFSTLNQWFLEPILDRLFPDYFFISYTTKVKTNTIFIIFLIATTLLKLSEDWFYFNREENRRLKISNQQIQTQLASLRSQINPHFLFNSLNVIYDLAIDKKEETKDAIVQLSDILRYIIYDSDAKTLLLKDELNLIKNYIEFHKFRSHNFRNIVFNCDVENDDYPIYPMLLLPLIENSFKHGNADEKEAFIKIGVVQKKNRFHFSIQNSNVVVAENTNTEQSGIGIENIKKNLELVYPEAHTFVVQETEDIFTVEVTLVNLEKMPNEN